MADNPVKWGALDSYTTVLSSANLKNLLTLDAVTGSEIDNTANYQYADFDLYIRFASAPAAGIYVSVWLLQAVDGTNYEDGSGTTTPVLPTRPADLQFPVAAVSTQQRIALRMRTLPNGKFKPYFYNNTTVGLTNTDNENILSYRRYNDNLVTA
jgi:hypothetical protein